MVLINGTDLIAIKNMAIDFLMLKPEFNNDGAGSVIHPFFTSELFPIKSGVKIEVLNLRNESDLLLAQNVFKNSINNMKSPDFLLLLMNRSYLPLFFKLSSPYWGIIDFSNFLKELWRFSEFPNMVSSITPDDFVFLFMSADKKTIMSSPEYTAFCNLPENIVVYQAFYTQNSPKRLSWFLSKNEAINVAQKWRKNHQIYRAIVKKSHVLACFNNYNTLELIIDFNKISNLTICE